MARKSKNRTQCIETVYEQDGDTVICRIRDFHTGQTLAEDRGKNKREAKARAYDALEAQN